MYHYHWTFRFLEKERKRNRFFYVNQLLELLTMSDCHVSYRELLDGGSHIFLADRLRSQQDQPKAGSARYKSHASSIVRIAGERQDAKSSLSFVQL